jgi:hypothetical protein
LAAANHWPASYFWTINKREYKDALEFAVAAFLSQTFNTMGIQPESIDE